MPTYQTRTGIKRFWHKVICLRLFGVTCLLVVIQLCASSHVVHSKNSAALRPAGSPITLLLQGDPSQSRDKGNVEDNSDQPKQSAAEPIISAKINVLSSPPFWAKSSAVVLQVSLEKVSGNQVLPYKEHPNISLLLGPADASFSHNRVEILAGSNQSDPFTLTSSQPKTIDVICTPDNSYEGPVINQSQPTRIEFITLINRIGIEPVSGMSTINIGSHFRVFLCNHEDLKTHLVPTTPVTIELRSQSDNGTFDVSKISLTDQQFSQDVRYVGTRMGQDTITALGFYLKNELQGESERLIVFPWLTFIAGLVGTLIGALIKVKTGQANERLKNFLESSVCGLSICMLIILFPVGTKLPQINTYSQPALEFVLSLFVAAFGPEFFKRLLSFVN